MKDIHVTKAVINKSYEKVWSYLSDPLNYPKLYPHWLSEVHKSGAKSYEGNGPQGKFKFSRKLDKKFGAIDLIIGEEMSRTRLFILDSETTLVIHLGVRWKEMKSPIAWFFYKRGVNKDFRNAKKIIEQS